MLLYLQLSVNIMEVAVGGILAVRVTGLVPSWCILLCLTTLNPQWAFVLTLGMNILYILSSFSDCTGAVALP